MTQKDILAIAKNPVAMEILAEIAQIQENMCYKTEFEKKTETRRMKELAKELIDDMEWKATTLETGCKIIKEG